MMYLYMMQSTFAFCFKVLSLHFEASLRVQCGDTLLEGVWSPGRSLNLSLLYGFMCVVRRGEGRGERQTGVIVPPVLAQ